MSKKTSFEAPIPGLDDACESVRLAKVVADDLWEELEAARSALREAREAESRLRLDADARLPLVVATSHWGRPVEMRVVRMTAHTVWARAAPHHRPSQFRKSNYGWNERGQYDPRSFSDAHLASAVSTWREEQGSAPTEEVTSG